MKALLLAAWCVIACQAQQPTHSFFVTGNFPRDLYGPLDTRTTGGPCNVGPCIWGHADQDIARIQFHPPAGQRVVITSITGNVIAAVKTLPGDPPAPSESWAGYIGGMQTSSSYADGATSLCDFCAQGAPVNAPGIVWGQGTPDSQRFDFHGSLPLDADNILIAKLGVFLNTTGKPIHVEITYNIEFHWEPQEQK